MIKVLEKALEKLETLSPEQQEYAARVIEQIAAAGDQVYALDDQERALVREGLADLDAGRTVHEDEMRAFWDRNRK